jgi:hypothetical protein
MSRRFDCRTASRLLHPLYVRGEEGVCRIWGASGEGRLAMTGRFRTDDFPGPPDLAVSPLVPVER